MRLPLLTVTQEEWEHEVDTLLRRSFPYLDGDVSSYIAGVLSRPEEAPSTLEELKKHQGFVWGIKIAAEDPRDKKASKLREKAEHLDRVGEGCLVIATFYRPFVARLPVIYLGEVSYRGIAMLTATAEGVYGMEQEHSPEVYLVIGDNFRGLTRYLSDWISQRFEPPSLFRPQDIGDVRYSRS